MCPSSHLIPMFYVGAWAKFWKLVILSHLDLGPWNVGLLRNKDVVVLLELASKFASFLSSTSRFDLKIDMLLQQDLISKTHFCACLHCTVTKACGSL